MKVRGLTAWALGSLAGLAAAQVPPTPAAPAASAAAPAVVRVRAVSIRPADPVYPEALDRRGVQGVVEVLAELGPDGYPTAVSVAKTSRSPELDQAGLAVVRDLQFGRPGAASAPAAAPLPPVTVPVEFLRDTVAALPKKTCAEFNVDVAYYRATFAEQKIHDMPVLRMTMGLLVMASGPSLNGTQLVALSRRVNAAAQKMPEVCAAAPDALYLQRFRELASQDAP